MDRKHIITLNPSAARELETAPGCGECPTSCQSACKTSCTVGNQVCLKKEEEKK